MMDWKRKTRLIVVFCCNCVLFNFLFGVSFLRAETMGDMKYLVSFNTKRSACMAKINDFPVIDNLTYASGTISTGFNITSFVENGENSIEIRMGSIDPNDKNTLYLDSMCQLTITKDTANSSQEVTSLILSVDKKGNIKASSSSNYDGLLNEGRVDESQSAESKEQDLYRVGRKVTLSGLPTWAWVHATPVSENDLPKIRSAYKEVWSAMKSRDVNMLKKLTVISNKEMGVAEGVSADTIFESYNLPEKVLDKNLSLIDLELEPYKIITYCNGRVFRFGRGIYQISPLKFQDSDGDFPYSYNPYFSIIDGKVVIVR
ncbi:hypothetical protein ABQ333_16180 [Serratia fonticola]|uniref:hypothetical protein n=1 Tax=Serratia fonticola TaxID=47917 RepID=UPI003AAC5C86